MVYCSLLTAEQPHLTKVMTMSRGTWFEAPLRFMLCHFNPRESEWTAPRVKCRLLASKRILIWLGIFVFLAIGF